MDIEDLDKYDFTEKRLNQVAKKFMKWYSKNKRDLPWRKIPRDKQLHAYRVWVSEIMAQQTRISTVIDYYKRWMKKFPTVEALSKADLKDGYYSRAKNLWKSAQLVMNEFDGEIPSDPKELQKLPGIGKYTAGAISSIVFGLQSPIVDGNVKRVLSRIQGIHLEEGSKREKLFWKLSNDLVTCRLNIKNPGDFNQSLMEFGALVCTPKSPKCTKCPFWGKRKEQKICHAFSRYRSGEIETVEIYPLKSKKKGKKKKKKVPLENRVVCIIEREKKNSTTKWVVRQRPQKGVILAGLYEFPNYPKSQLDKDRIEEEEEEEEEDLSIKQEFQLFCDRFMEEYEVQVDPNQGIFCGTLLHKFSHLHQKYSVFRFYCDDQLEEVIKFKSDEEFSSNLEWMDRSQLEQSGTSTLTKKILKKKEKSVEDGTGVKVGDYKRKRQQKISSMFKKKKKKRKKKKKKRKLD